MKHFARKSKNRPLKKRRFKKYYVDSVNLRNLNHKNIKLHYILCFRNIEMKLCENEHVHLKIIELFPKSFIVFLLRIRCEFRIRFRGAVCNSFRRECDFWFRWVVFPNQRYAACNTVSTVQVTAPPLWVPFPRQRISADSRWLPSKGRSSWRNCRRLWPHCPLRSVHSQWRFPFRLRQPFESSHSKVFVSALLSLRLQCWAFVLRSAVVTSSAVPNSVPFRGPRFWPPNIAAKNVGSL